MKTVWKFPLAVEDMQVVAMPANARILCVQAQHGSPCLWALVDSSKPQETRTILITGTGHERDDLDGLVEYIGTFQMANGMLIFHVFEDLTHASTVPAEVFVQPTPTQ